MKIHNLTGSSSSSSSSSSSKQRYPAMVPYLLRTAGECTPQIGIRTCRNIPQSRSAIVPVQSTTTAKHLGTGTIPSGSPNHCIVLILICPAPTHLVSFVTRRHPLTTTFRGIAESILNSHSHFHSHCYRVILRNCPVISSYLSFSSVHLPDNSPFRCPDRRLPFSLGTKR
jgi:hypothetical protein